MRQLEELIGIGCTIEVACANLGITRQTFYNWRRASAEWCALGDAYPRMPVAVENVPILTFLTRITRAQARSLAVATTAAYSGLIERRYTETRVVETGETRLRRDETGAEVPYFHVTDRHIETVEHVIPADWRAGIEWNRRRDPATWNPPQKIEVSWQDQAVADIRVGALTYEDLVDWFDESLAAELFARAGVPVPRSTDKTGQRTP